MTAERPTGLTVTLPLVWDADVLTVPPFGMIGYVHQWQDTGLWGAYAAERGKRQIVNARKKYFGDFPTRAEAKAAVEAAAMKAMGGVG